MNYKNPLLRKNIALATLLPLSVTACSDRPDEVRGVDHDETRLSVSASGQAESRPDKAEFQAGIESWAGTAKAASDANADKITKIVSALREMGVKDEDIQTRSVNVQRVNYGDRKGQYQASNIVRVTMRNPDKAGDAVTAVTGAGANIVSGPNLSMTDPETTANMAYANAYKAARKRAEAYAEAAGMKISRVLFIRDAGGTQGDMWIQGAPAPEEMVTVDASSRPPPPVAPPPPPPPANIPANMMLGTTQSSVNVQVDFALREK